MIANIFQELGGHWFGYLVGVLAGGLFTWFYGRWKRFEERREIAKGDARDTIVIQQHLVESAEEAAPEGDGVRRVAKVLRLRTLGQAELSHVVPNGYLADVLLERAFAVTPKETLISMEGAEGSYLLETLTNFVCDRVATGSFERDLYVMAPCCEPAGMARHQPITILLIRQRDLRLFEDWTACRDVLVEHGGDGTRVLTLREMAKRFRQEQREIAAHRKEGRRTTHVETMYLLDLPLDERAASVPARRIPWERFKEVLSEVGLESVS